MHMHMCRVATRVRRRAPPVYSVRPVCTHAPLCLSAHTRPCARRAATHIYISYHVYTILRLKLQLRTCLHIYVQLRTSGGLAEVRSFEVSFLEDAVELFAAAGANYSHWGRGGSLYRALGSVISARAKVTK